MIQNNHGEFYNRNKKYYDRNAAKYERASWYFYNKYKNNQIEKELNKCTQLLGKKEIRVLEIGPGTGYLLSKLLSIKDIKIDYTAIEHSDEMEKILTARYSGLCNNLRILNQSVSGEAISNLDITNKYDLIMGSSILHHIVDYETVVEELSKRLMPNGVMYFVREPIHRDDCVVRAGGMRVVVELFAWIYGMINNMYMAPIVRKYLFPGKIKAEDASQVAYHMFKDGVSTKPFDKLIQSKLYNRMFHRRYNRRLSTAFSYVENEWLKYLRKDIFGNTLYSICLQKR